MSKITIRNVSVRFNARNKKKVDLIVELDFDSSEIIDYIDYFSNLDHSVRRHDGRSAILSDIPIAKEYLIKISIYSRIELLETVEVTVPHTTSAHGQIFFSDEIKKALESKQETHSMLLERVRQHRRASFASIGLNNPKTPANVGAVLRAAECYNVASIAISGDRIKGHHIDSATNVTNSHKKIPVYRGDLKTFIPFGAVPVAVELVDDAESLFTFEHPRQAFYIFGAEDQRLGKAVLDWCPKRIMIPTSICMNLAACVNVVLYDRAAKELRR